MANRLPPMQALRAFEAAARERSLTRAAESLSLTHGAVSHQIKALEADLGVRLVERAGRGIRLTDAGERFAARVRVAFAELTAAVRDAHERANPRRLRVSTTPSFASRWLLPRIGSFVAAHPEFDLDVSANSAYVDFQREDVDVAIRHGLGHWPGIESEFLHDDTFFPVASPWLAGGRLPSRPEELARFTLLRAEGEPWRPWFDAAGLAWPEPERGPSFSDSSHLMQAAADGQGIALARSSLLGNDLRNGVLVRLFDIEVPSPRGYYLVYPPRNADAPKIAALRAWLREEFARDDREIPRTKPAPRGRAAKR
jgi:LysR family transcriptional regulator, glycine cleavage system transcriptional activator